MQKLVEFECNLYSAAAAAAAAAAATAANSIQSCPTLCDPLDCSLPGFSIHGFFQARVLEWGAIAFSLNMLSIAIFNSCLIVLKSKTVRSKMVVTSYI